MNVLFMKSFVVAVLTFGVVESAFSETKESEYDRYLLESYRIETFGKLVNLSRELKQFILFDKLDDIDKKLNESLFSRIEELETRILKMTVALAKEKGNYSFDTECNYFVISVALKGIRRALAKLKQCSRELCGEQEIRIQKRILFQEFMEIQGQAGRCS